MSSIWSRIRFRGLCGLFVELCLGRQGIMQDQICGQDQLLFGELALWGLSIGVAVSIESNIKRQEEEEGNRRTARFKELSFVKLVLG